MSRAAQFQTDIVTKNAECLREAAEATAKELNGQVVDQIHYYAGKVLGIRVGHREIGIVVGKDGKVSFVGEDLNVHNKDFRDKVGKLLKKNYVTASVTRVAKRIGLREVHVSRAVMNIVSGVR
ncbi:MAG: hypothetical protein C0402_05435 [Thermodesulfovibrio sp.]|nr:hypothetical protein [Thermodesulfovibrio sp.]